MASIFVDSITAFDATLDRKVTFTYSGNQCVANSITVYNSMNNAEVYTNRITSYALSHTIPANALTNGGSYYVKITAYYIDGTEENSITSPASNVFSCLKTPVWRFSNIAEGAVIRNASLQVLMYYEQEQGDLLNEFYVELYDYGHVLKYRSAAKYNADDPVDIFDLEDNAIYYLRAYGTTVSGLYIDTRTTFPNDVMITVDYIVAEVYSQAGLENVPDHGSIRVSLNVAHIEGYSANGKAFSYTDSEYINLEDDMVVFDENVYMEDSFTFLLRGKNFLPDTVIMIVKAADNGSVASVKLRSTTISGELVYYAELRCQRPDSKIEYVLYTDFVPLDLTQDIQIMVWFQRGYFGLALSEVTS